MPRIARQALGSGFRTCWPFLRIAIVWVLYGLLGCGTATPAKPYAGSRRLPATRIIRLVQRMRKPISGWSPAERHDGILQWRHISVPQGCGHPIVVAIPPTTTLSPSLGRETEPPCFAWPIARVLISFACLLHPRRARKTPMLHRRRRSRSGPSTSLSSTRLTTMV